MLVQDDEEIQVCKLDKKGRIEILPLNEENSELFSSENSFDIYNVFKDCVNYRTPAWYFIARKEVNLIPERLFIESPGRTLNEAMLESYRYRYEEDLELGKKLRAFEVDIIGCEDKEG